MLDQLKIRYELLGYEIDLADLSAVDQGALAHETISISAGQRGLQILLSAQDYVRATSATLAALERDSPDDEQRPY